MRYLCEYFIEVPISNFKSLRNHAQGEQRPEEQQRPGSKPMKASKVEQRHEELKSILKKAGSESHSARLHVCCFIFL